MPGVLCESSPCFKHVGNFHDVSGGNFNTHFFVAPLLSFKLNSIQIVEDELQVLILDDCKID